MYILFAGVFYCFQQFYDHTSSPILSTNSLRQTQTYSPETWQLSQRRQRQMYNEFNNMSLTFDSVIFHFHFFSLYFRELLVWCFIFHFIMWKDWERGLDCWCEEEALICLSLRGSEAKGESILRDIVFWDITNSWNISCKNLPRLPHRTQLCCLKNKNKV